MNQYVQVEDIARTEISLLAAEPRSQNPDGSSNQIHGFSNELVPDVPPLKSNSMKDHTGRTKLIKRGRKKKDSALKKCAKRLAESAIGNYSHSPMETECLSQKQEHDVSNNFGSLKNGIKRKKKKMHLGIHANKVTLENGPASPINLATPNETFRIETSAFPEVEKNRFPDKSCKNGRASKKTDFGIDANKVNPENVLANSVSLGAPDVGRKSFGTEILALPEVKKVCQFPENSRTKIRGRKKAHFGNDANNTNFEDIPTHPISLGSPKNGTEVSAFQQVENFSQFPEKSCNNGESRRDQRVLAFCRKFKKQKLDLVDKKLPEEPSFKQNQHDDCAIPDLTTAPSAISTSTDQKRGHEKQEKSSSDCIITSEYDKITQEKHDGVQANQSQLSENPQCSTDAKNLDSVAKKVRSEKHERFDYVFQCAFCLSQEESEVDQLRPFIYFNLFLILIVSSSPISNQKIPAVACFNATFIFILNTDIGFWKNGSLFQWEAD